MLFLATEIGFVDKIMRQLMAFLCQLIYPLISWLYDLFMNISQVNILSTEDVQPIYQRVTLILTIVMVFYITFQFVKYVVQPDGITDKEKGVANLVYKMVMVVVLIAFVPSIFEWAFNLQNAIVKDGIIGNIIVGVTDEIEPDKLGKTFSNNIFSMFYGVDSEYAEEECDGIKCGTLVAMNLSALGDRGELTYVTKGLESGIEVDTEIQDEKAVMPLINFDGLLAVVVGCFMVYILAMYCIDVGARWAQMIFLQIIAPIPIIGYLSPKKDGMFQKWCKQCMTTYLDLFIRIAIIYFVLLICSILLESRINGNLLKGLGEISPIMEVFIYIALVLGILLFAKKAPKMLSELFPSSGAAAGSFGFGKSAFKDKFSPVGTAFTAGKRVVGGVAGGLAGAAIGARTGRFFDGMVKGAKAGGAKKGGLIGNVGKGVGTVRSDVEKDLDVKAKGGSIYGARFFGGHNQSKAKAQDRRIADLDDMSTKKKAVSSAIEDVKFRKQMDSVGSALTSSGNVEAAKEWEGKKKQAEKFARQYADGKIDAATFRANMDTMISDFRRDYNVDSNINLDLELDNAAKWGNVHSALEDAKKTARDLAGTEYEDMQGNKQQIEYNEDTFADDIGDITDAAAAAASQQKRSDEYKKAHANANGNKS